MAYLNQPLDVFWFIPVSGDGSYLGSAIRLDEEEIPQVSAIFARCLAIKSHRRVANE